MAHGLRGISEPWWRRHGGAAHTTQIGDTEWRWNSRQDNKYIRDCLRGVRQKTLLGSSEQRCCLVFKAQLRTLGQDWGLRGVNSNNPDGTTKCVSFALLQQNTWQKRIDFPSLHLFGGSKRNNINLRNQPLVWVEYGCIPYVEWT